MGYILRTKAKTTEQIAALGLKASDTVMLHASMRAIGPVMGGPDQVLQAIIDCIGPQGTLMMYIGCAPEYESIGRGKLNVSQEQEIFNNCPAFDPITSRARYDYGISAEFLRSTPGVICSANPGARVAAFGAKAAWLVADHPLNYGYGPGSPLANLYESNGKILLLGSDLDQVTILHYVEHIAPVDPKHIVKFKVPLLKDGQRVWVDIEEYDTSIGIRNWPENFFAGILQRYLVEDGPQFKSVGNVGSARSYLIDAKQLVDFAIPIMISTATLI